MEFNPPVMDYLYGINSNNGDQDVENPCKKARMSQTHITFNSLSDDKLSELVVFTEQFLSDDKSDMVTGNPATVYYAQPPTPPSPHSPKPAKDLLAMAIEEQQLWKVFHPTPSTPHKDSSEPPEPLLQEKASPYQPINQEVLSSNQSDMKEAPSPYLQEAPSPYLQEAALLSVAPIPGVMKAESVSPTTIAPLSIQSVAVKDDRHYGTVIQEQQQQQYQSHQQPQYPQQQQHHQQQCSTSSMWMMQRSVSMHKYPGYMFLQQGQHHKHQAYPTWQVNQGQQQMHDTQMQYIQTLQKQASQLNHPSFNFTSEPAKPVCPRSIKPNTPTAVSEVHNNPQIYDDMCGHTCEVCGEDFPSASSKASHKRIHTGSKSFYCTLCSKSFKQKSDFRYHVLTDACTRLAGKIRQASDTTWECTDCGANKFDSEQKAQRHARQHDSGMTKICPVCRHHCPCKGYGIVRHMKELHPDHLVKFGL